MPLSPKMIRTQLNMLRPLLKSCSLETIRKGQDRVGELMEAQYRGQVLVKRHGFDGFEGAWIIPEDERRQGVVLYLHGGGYTCGGVEYAKGFGSMLAVRCGVRVFCAAYRLAPEHRFPAAVEDVLTAYRYLLEKGYSRIVLCGESAGGGLCYSLCFKLRELGLPMPGGVITISPWTDLTASGSSYRENREKDPSMTAEMLDFFARSYTDNRLDPMVSPLFGNMTGMPPSLIFVGGDEIMRSDAEQLQERLLEAGAVSRLIVRPERWHGYVLYGLKEDQEDMDEMNRFLNQHLYPERKLRWMPLDNAAKIYPAARRQNWINVFRLSATLTEDVDTKILESALDVTVRRFPSIAARLRRGVFWYYLQQLEDVPRIRQESSYPLTPMSREELRQCALRVIVYKRRIAVEFFHSLTDGNGGLVFLKTLVAEYLQQKHGIHIPAEQGVLGRLEEPSEAELEDSFLKHAGPVAASRKATDAWRIEGEPETDGYRNVTCLELPVKQVLAKAHEYDVSLTQFLCASMMMAIQNLQEERVSDPLRRKHVKVLVPVNLRKIFGSRTLRNFVLYTTPEIDPRLGHYSFQEICQAVKSKMAAEVNRKFMSSMIETNVSSERVLALKLTPLFLKNTVMKMVYNAVGERKSCLSLSNLGQVKVPEIMAPYLERFDFILGVQATSHYNCGVVSFGDNLIINFIRGIREPALERHFHQVLRDFGLPVQVRSNQR